MTYYKYFIGLLIVSSQFSVAEMQPVSDQDLAELIGQAGITIDQTIPFSADSIVLDLEGSDGVSVITGNRLDSNPNNDRAIMDIAYQGLTFDVLDAGVLSIGMPRQLTINNFEASYYLSETAEITPTTYTTEAQTYTAYINTVSDDPDHSGFTLSMQGATFSNGSNTYSGTYAENQLNSNIDGASVTFTIDDPTAIDISVVSDDRVGQSCTLLIFCTGDDSTDDGEIIIVDSNGDLVAYSSTPGFDASLTDLAVNPNRVVDQLGSNFFISAKMSGTFNLTGSLNIMGGVLVEDRY